MPLNLNYLLQQAKAKMTIKSILTDVASMGLGILLMLLMTNDNPFIAALGISIFVTLVVVVWRGLKNIVKYQFLAKKAIKHQENQHLVCLKTIQNSVKSLVFDNEMIKLTMGQKSFDNSHLSLCFYSSGQNLKSALGHLNQMKDSQFFHNQQERVNLKKFESVQVSSHQKQGSSHLKLKNLVDK